MAVRPSLEKVVDQIGTDESRGSGHQYRHDLPSVVDVDRPPEQTRSGPDAIAAIGMPPPVMRAPVTSDASGLPMTYQPEAIRFHVAHTPTAG